jgi:hypothetical protein
VVYAGYGLLHYVSSEHSECKDAKDTYGNSVYSVMDYTFPVLFLEPQLQLLTNRVYMCGEEGEV